MDACPSHHLHQQRFDHYDAWFCPDCGWRSPKCSDPECCFCAKRPDNPFNE